MAQTITTKTLGDLPVYDASASGYNGHVLYTDSNIEYRLPMSGLITSVKTFADGFTISSVNEEVQYNGVRMVWNGVYPKTVDAGSTPASSGGFGANAWAYADDGALRAGLTSYYGPSMLGYVPSVAALRTITPTVDKQRFWLSAYTVGGNPRGGGDFYYDAADTTTADDGIITFVTSSGARLKRITHGRYNLAMAGVNPGDDATLPLKTLIALILAKYKAITTGASVPINYNNAIIEVDPGTYIISSTVQIYSVISIVACGDVTFDGRSVVSGEGIFKLSNDNFALAYKPKYFEAGPLLNGAGGTINIVGSQTVPGLAVGNTLANMVNLAGYMAHNLHITYCSTFINFNGAIDTYLLHFDHLGCYGATSHGIAFPATSYTNSGERISFDEVTLGGIKGNAIQITQAGLMLSLSNLSIDFANGHGINIDAGAGYVQVDVTSGSHVEGIDQYFICNLAGTTKISWNGGQWLPTSRTSGTASNYHGRPLVYGYLQGVKLRDILILNTSPADGSSVYLGLPSNTTTPAAFDVSGILDYFGYVPSLFNIANIGSDFSSETVGATLTSSNTALTKFQKPADITYWLNTCTATVVSLSDGTQALQIVPTTTGLISNYLVLTTTDYIPVVSTRSQVKVWLVGQVLTSAIRYRVQTGVKWYDADKNLLSTSVAGGLSDLYTNSQRTSSPSYSSVAETNGARKLATLANGQLAPIGAVYAKPVWTISGIDQTINVNALCCAVL